MQKKIKSEKKLLDKIFLIVVSAQTILMGILFIIQILRIYLGNDATFTREICGEYLLQILPIIILWIILIAASGIYFFNKKKDKNIANITSIAKLINLENICPEYNENLDSEYKLLSKEKKKRRIVLIGCFVILIICSIMGLLYLLNTKHFDPKGDLTAQALKMAVHLSPWVIIAFSSFILYVIYEEISARKSIEIIKFIIKNSKKEKVRYIENRKQKLTILISRLSILTIAITLIIIGIFDGGASSVLQKAVNICTECIGLG